MTIKTLNWQTLEQLTTDASIIDALESGAVVYLPQLPFEFSATEKYLLTPDILPQKSKNISYDPHRGKLKAFDTQHKNYQALEAMMARYAKFAETMVVRLFPTYQKALTIARTSFRPVEVIGRKAPSYRKDDMRLHIDAFPATPNQGRRLLRVFSNVNPNGKPRVWRIGEPFEQVAAYFGKQLSIPPAFIKHWLKFFHITRGLRSDYDALMLQLHDQMKKDLNYQKQAMQQQIDLAAGGTWIVYTDQVSHAAMSGQFCLEQTFTLPVTAMKDPQKSPLKILERQMGRHLI